MGSADSHADPRFTSAAVQAQEVKPCEVQPEFDFRFTSELALSFRPDSAPPLTEQQCFSTS